MKPKSHVHLAQREMFRVERELLADARHSPVKPGRWIDWAGFEVWLGATHVAANGAPGRSTRLLVALHSLQ